jgi:hypothetical protein
MHQERAPFASFHEPRDIVHPRVVRAEVAAPDENETVVGTRPGRSQPLQIGNKLRRRKDDPAARRLKRLRE